MENYKIPIPKLKITTRVTSCKFNYHKDTSAQVPPKQKLQFKILN